MTPSQKPILVIGDLILDCYINGKSVRLSPEAPVPVVQVSDYPEYRLGGSANVAANIKALGGNPLLCGVAGNCADSAILFDLLDAQGIDHNGVGVSKRKLPVKTRVIANNQQIVRMDSEETASLNSYDEVNLLRNLDTVEHINEIFGAIVISDYAKGTLTPKIMQWLQTAVESRDVDIPVFYDPKIRKGMPLVNRHTYVITPNLHEAEAMAGMELHNGVDEYATLMHIGDMIRSKYRTDYVLLTRGEAGMTLIGHRFAANFPAKAQSVFDVSGAGDTVIAALALAKISGSSSLEDAVMVANTAAGIVVGKRGTSVVTLGELNLTLANS